MANNPISLQSASATKNPGSPHFNNFSGSYTYDFVSQLEAAGITRASQITKISFVLDTHFLRGSKEGLDNYAMDDDYAIKYYNTSNPVDETAITELTHFSHKDSTTLLAGTTFTVTSSQLNSVATKILSGPLTVSIAKDESGGQAYFYYGPQKEPTIGYNNDNKGLMTCKVYWEDNRKKVNLPSGITLSQTTATLEQAGSYITLSWNELSIPSGASNIITGVEIWRKKDNGSWAKIDEGDLTGTSTSCYVMIPTTGKGTYYYTVRPTTDAGDAFTYSAGELEAAGRVAFLTVSEIGSVSAPTSVSTSYGSDNYIGKDDLASGFNLYWSGAKDGTNNPIQSYTIITPSGREYSTLASASSCWIQEVPNIGTYKVIANGKQGSATKAVSLFNALPVPQAPTITSQPSGTIIKPTFEIGWNRITSYPSVNSIKYIVYKRAASVNDWTPVTETVNTSITLNSSELGSNVNCIIGIASRYYSANGSYTDSINVCESNTLKYSPSISLPEPFWKSYYDSMNNMTGEGEAEIIYNTITLKWRTMIDTTSGSSFKYEVYRSVDNSNGELIGTISNTSINTIAEYTDNDVQKYKGRYLKYYIKVINTITNQTQDSTPTGMIKVIEPIQITRFEAVTNNITSTDLPIIFDWQSGVPNTTSGSGINAYLDITYSNTTAAGFWSMSNIPESIKNTPQTVTISLRGQSSNTGVLGALYNSVINQGYPQPEVKLKLRLQYTAFRQSFVEKELSSVKLSYFTEPISYGTLNVSYPSGRSYYNPGEKATVGLSGFNWRDAAGGSTNSGTTVKKYLLYKATKQEYEFSGSTATVELPNQSATDTTLSLVLVADINYIGANITKRYESQVTCGISIARWIEEVVSISNVRKTERTGWDGWLEGSLIIPERYCGSDLYQNTVNIIPSLIDNSITCVFTNDNSQNGLNNNNILTTFQPSQLISDSSGKKRIINFLIYSQEEKETNYANIMLNFNVIFTNTSTSNNTLTIDNILYRVLSAEVDFAVRKGKIGVNVPKDFGTSTDTSNSVLELNTTKTSEDAIVKITSAGSIENGKTKYISFLDSSGQKELSMYTENGKVYIDDLHIDKLLSPNKNTILTLNNSDILFFNGTKNETVLTSENYSEYINLTLVGANNSGTVPEYGTSSGGTITTTAANRVLTVNDGTLGWYSLPENAFKDTTYDAATTTSMGLMSAADKVKLNGIATEANKYVLPNATTSTLGGVIVGRGLTVSSGTISTHKIIYQTTEPTSGMQAGDLWLKPKN